MTDLAAAKGLIVSVQTEAYTTKSRAEKSKFRFSAGMEKQVTKSDRLAPAATMTLDALADATMVLIRTNSGKVTVTGLINGVQSTLIAEPLLIITGNALGALTITNSDATGTPEKDVIVEAYV